MEILNIVIKYKGWKRTEE